MNNKEKIQKTFSKLHANPNIIDNILNDEQIKILPNKSKLSTVAAAVIATIIILGTATTAYAMDLCGIQRTVQLWIYGDQTDAIFTVENGNYELEYTNENGELVTQHGGGVEINTNGTTRPLTSDELFDHINELDVIYNEDGSVWLYYLNQKFDITNKFEDEVCYIKLEIGDKLIYVTVKYNNGYAYSPNNYVQPSKFNCE